MNDQMILKQFNAPENATLVHQFKNGNIKIAHNAPCDRCGGEGIYYMGVCNGKPVPSWVENGVCFKCGGSGVQRETKILMTPENEAKAEAKRREREAQIAKEWAEKQAERERREQEEREKQARIDAERAAAKAISKFVGNIGDKIETKLTLDHSGHWEQKCFSGFGTETMYCHVFKDSDGNTYTWKTQNTVCTPDGNGSYIVAEKGDVVVLKGTIKDHVEYDGEKQTVLTRCKCLKIN